MVTLLARLCIKDYRNTENPSVRGAYGILCSIVGIVLNLLLFAGKYLAGSLSGSLAIMADAFNNLSDAASSFVTLIGFRFAGRGPDTDHPFGHGRYEYISGLVVSFLILLMGIELGQSSIEKILHPEAMEGGWLTVLILLVSIAVKFYMHRYNRKIGEKIDSAAMKATAMDSLSDSIATAVVLICTVIYLATDVNLDGWGGGLVALFIIYTGITSIRDTLSPLLGQAPDPEYVQKIETIVKAHPEILGIHDLVVHDYGPGHRLISLHGEVSGDGDIYVLHDVIDRIEQELHEKLGCEAVIHMDPIAANDEHVNAMREKVEELLAQWDSRISLHDFRMVEGPTHTNLIFDAVVPQDLAATEETAKKKIEQLIAQLGEQYRAVVKIDRFYVK
ncbi:MAG TPA: cation transporter [Candidatus Faecimorpha stercoravium]|nr:cation transporter [Candidatus Faecimorpha stercoravium]